MSARTKASILWIMLLQARQFSLGEVNILCEFSTMHSDLRAKKAAIHHGEVPKELIDNSSTAPEDEDNGGQGKHKRRKLEDATWNHKLKAALAGPLAAAGHPSFSKIMRFCKQDAYGVFSKKSGICAPHAILGTCFHGEKCNKRHITASDQQADEALKLLTPFLKTPTAVNEGP